VRAFVAESLVFGAKLLILLNTKYLTEKRVFGLDSGLGHLGVFWVEFDADAVALELVGDEGGGAAAEEGVEDGVTGFAAGEDRAAGDLGGEGGEVGFREGLGAEQPEVPYVA
jgi:hypothetical protein